MSKKVIIVGHVFVSDSQKGHQLFSLAKNKFKNFWISFIIIILYSGNSKKAKKKSLTPSCECVYGGGLEPTHPHCCATDSMSPK